MRPGCSGSALLRCAARRTNLGLAGPATCTSGWLVTPLTPAPRAAASTWSMTSLAGTAAYGIGPALSYVRLEDEAQAAALLARPDAADAGLAAHRHRRCWSRPSRRRNCSRCSERPDMRPSSRTPTVRSAPSRPARACPAPRRARSPSRRRRPSWPPPCWPRTRPSGTPTPRTLPEHRRGGPRPAISDPGSPPGPGPLRHRGRPAGRTRTGSAGPGCRHDAGGGPGHGPGHHNSAGPHFFGLSCHTPRLD